MLQIRQDMVIDNGIATEYKEINLNLIDNNVFSLGPTYSYIVDFYDMSISNISDGFYKTHGVPPENISFFNDTLSMIYPGDLDFIARAEKTGTDFLYKTLGIEKSLQYKFSYNLRLLKSDGTYSLFNHQSLVLAIDNRNNFMKSLCIRTDISHLLNKVTNTISFIGLGEHPSYLHIKVREEQVVLPTPSQAELKVLKLVAEGLSSREIAQHLFISMHTVRTHRKNMLEKYHCHTSSALVNKAIAEGWI